MVLGPDRLLSVGGACAEIAALPAHRATIDGWKRINQLNRGKPMVWINEVPWHEMDVDGELTLQCQNEFCRVQERQLRWPHEKEIDGDSYGATIWKVRANRYTGGYT